MYPKQVIATQIWFGLTRFRKDVSVYNAHPIAVNVFQYAFPTLKKRLSLIAFRSNLLAKTEYLRQDETCSPRRIENDGFEFKRHVTCSKQTQKLYIQSADSV